MKSKEDCTQTAYQPSWNLFLRFPSKADRNWLTIAWGCGKQLTYLLFYASLTDGDEWGAREGWGWKDSHCQPLRVLGDMWAVVECRKRLCHRGTVLCHIVAQGEGGLRLSGGGAGHYATVMAVVIVSIDYGVFSVTRPAPLPPALQWYFDTPLGGLNTPPSIWRRHPPNSV